MGQVLNQVKDPKRIETTHIIEWRTWLRSDQRICPLDPKDWSDK